MKPASMIVWDKRTLAGLAMFEELLRECASLDRANCHLARTARIIELAERLDATDYSGRKPSFKATLVRSANEAVMAGKEKAP